MKYRSKIVIVLTFDTIENCQSLGLLFTNILFKLLGSYPWKWYGHFMAQLFHSRTVERWSSEIIYLKELTGTITALPYSQCSWKLLL